MKKIILAAVWVTTASLSYGQCDKKVVLTASQTQHLATDSSIQNSKDELTVIEFDRSNITVTPGDNTMTGTVKSYTCDWSTPYKVGRTTLKVMLTNQDGESKSLTLTIDGKDGKIILLAKIDDEPEHRIRLYADKFEEKH
jgi:hypothetical protein